MATLVDLEAKKRELEVRLANGDLSVEPALDRLDRAIVARMQKIQYSRKRLSAAHDAVDAGMNPVEARKKQSVPAKGKKPVRGPINRF